MLHRLSVPAAGRLYGVASRWWRASRIRIALREENAERREAAARAVPWLLERQPSLAKFQAVLDAMGRPGGSPAGR